MICEDRAVQPEHADVFGWIISHGIAKPRSGKKLNKRQRKYIDALCAFDIETSVLQHVQDRDGNIGPQAYMWVWQFQLGADVTVVGRTWEEYRQFCAEIEKACKSLDAHLVVWVHNLSYEFQFLSGIWDIDNDDVFAVKPRKVLRCDIGHIEYRDSYLQTNMSLDAFTHKMDVKHQKLSGELDYKKLRFPWTPISSAELAYCLNDVRGLVEAIDAEMRTDGDDLYTIPMTSTGYVRRDVKKAMWPLVDRLISQLLPEPDLYLLLRDAFWGGDTHANRYFVGQKIEHVKSADKASAYPAAQCENLFPMSPFIRQTPSAENLKRARKCRKALVCRIALYNVHQRYSWWGFPYIPLSKCQACQNPVIDNGRILQADYLVLACTDIDLDIILREYDFDGCRVFDLWTAKYGRLPKKFTDVVKKYYTAKTELKGVKGQELYYTKSKNKLNGIYGMTAQKPVRPDVEYDGTAFHELPILETELPTKLAQAYKKAFLPYQWAVWTTAHVRASLKDMQWAAGKGGVYCDTDCVKYIGYVDLRPINNPIRQRARAAQAYAKDPAGKVHYMGVFETEEEYAEFMTWGAKKYATTHKRGGPITTTIAGVNKTKGGPELERAGGFAAFKPGFVFRDAGGSDLFYNDAPNVAELKIDGHTLKITKNVVILDGEYTLGITAEYAKLLGLTMEEK